MNTYYDEFRAKAALCFMSFMIVLATTMFLLNPPSDIKATGGAGEIKGLIDPIIDRALNALQNNNTDLAYEEIQNLKNELNDTFEVDEEEDKDDDDKKKD